MHLRKISSALHIALESLSLINVPLSTVEMAELKQQIATCTSCITFDFHFSWVLQPSQFKLREPLERGYNEFQSNGSTAKSWTFCGLLYGIDHGKVSQTCIEQ